MISGQVRAAPSGAQAAPPQWSRRGQHKPTLTKPKVCAGQDRELLQGQLEAIQHGPAVWASLPPWSVRLARSLCPHLITHAEPNHLSGNSSVNSSCVLQWQILLSSNQPGHTHYVGEKGRKISTILSSFFGGWVAFADNASAFPAPHHMGYSLYFVLSAAALRARIKNSLWKM